VAMSSQEESKHRKRRGCVGGRVPCCPGPPCVEHCAVTSQQPWSCVEVEDRERGVIV
jgi:hypothetical protein